MNKKIKDIMKECYVNLLERDGDNVYDMEKFAKLIIRECSNVAMDNLDCPASAIETHFGVE